MDLELLAATRAEYKSNKVRKQERWFDWTPPSQDALDLLVQGRREVDPVPYDVRARAFTPYTKRFEMDGAYSETANTYKETKEISQKMMDGRFRPTSIFGGQQATPNVLPGRGWGEGMGFKKPAPAETERNHKCEAKYASSSFPEKYDAFADKEYNRLRRKARGLS